MEDIWELRGSRAMDGSNKNALKNRVRVWWIPTEGFFAICFLQDLGG